MNVYLDYLNKIGEEKPWRKRVEGYLIHEGKVFGGTYKDKSFAVPGGGIDKGESIIEAFKRELKEETGHDALDLTVAKVKPVRTKFVKGTAQDKVDKYSGAETYFVLGKFKPNENVDKSELDKWPAKNKGLHPIDYAIDLFKKNKNKSHYYQTKVKVLNQLKAIYSKK